MTSPLRDYSFVEGEKLSPIKLDTAAYVAHPHGLAAKNNARRNTIHAEIERTRIRTPLAKSNNDSSDPKTSTVTGLFTSPRANRHPKLDLSKNLFNPTLKLKKLPPPISLQSDQIDHQIDQFDQAYQSKSVKQIKPGHDSDSRRDSDKENNTLHTSNPSLKGYLRNSNDSFIDSSPSKASRKVSQTNSTDNINRNGTLKTRKRSFEIDNNNNSSISEVHKIARVVTNANDSLFVLDDRASNTLMSVDNVFNKEDLVGLISKPSKSAVIDNDSDDSDLEVRNSGVQEFSHTTTSLQAKKFHPEHTQTSRIILNNNLAEYITPQRLTEPVAQSPQTSQSARITESVGSGVKMTASPLSLLRLDTKSSLSGPGKIVDVPVLEADSTTPMPMVGRYDGNEEGDQHHGVEILPENDPEADEPTINFLMSPNSKPVFSMDYVKKIQNSNTQEVIKLEAEIRKRNNEILKFSEELAATNGKFLELDEKIRELTQENKQISSNEELVKVQLKHTERELAKASKTLKLRQNYIQQMEARDSKYKDQLQSTLKELSVMTSKKDNLAAKNEAFERQISDQSLLARDSQRRIQELESQISSKNLEIKSLVDANDKERRQIETISKEYENLVDEIELLRRENGELQSINDKQSGLVEELDKLETLAKDKIANMEISAKKDAEKIEELQSLRIETQKRYDEDLKTQEALLDEVSKALEHVEKIETDKRIIEDKYSKLLEQFEQASESAAKFEKQNAELVKVKESLQPELNQLKDQVESLQASNKEKDEIIKQDTNKFKELMEIVTAQKQSILNLEEKVANTQKEAAEESTQNVKVAQETKEYQEEISKLKAEVKRTQEELNKAEQKVKVEVDKVAETLYYQYSKKHEQKVAEVRKSMELKFRKQIDHLELRTKSQNRDLESLEKKLEAVNAEKTQLLSYVEGYKEREESRRRSPKRSLKRY